MFGVGEVSEEGENWDGALDLRSFVGVPICVPDSSTGMEEEGLGFLSPDPFAESFDRFLPLTSVAWLWLPSPRNIGVSTAPPFSGPGVVDDLLGSFLFLTDVASVWKSTDLRSSRTLSV